MWTVIGDAGHRARERCLLVRCDCGHRRAMKASQYRAERTQTCRACSDRRKKKHGESGSSESAEWRTWCGIRSRCSTDRLPTRRNYKDRGIVVCERWATSFDAFLQDMGRRPSPEHSIDRIDNDGNYEPGNCRWATMVEQQRNKRGLHMVEIGGESMCLTDWASRLGLKMSFVRQRLGKGWSALDALLVPKCTGYSRQPGSRVVQRRDTPRDASMRAGRKRAS